MGNYTTFQLPAFSEALLPKIIKIQRHMIESQLKMPVIFLMRRTVYFHCSLVLRILFASLTIVVPRRLIYCRSRVTES